MTNSFVRLDEVPNEGHWFDGVVDDDALQPFLTRHLAAQHKPRLPVAFSVMTMNPGTSGSRGGLRIRQLLTPTQSGRLKVLRDGNKWHVEPENVRRFSYAFVDMVRERAEHVTVAGREFKVIDQGLELCRESAAEWRTCSGPGNGERDERQYGPLSHVLLGEVIVVCPSGDEELLREAMFYANGLYIHGINAQVVRDTVAIQEGVLESSAGVILFGGPNVNIAAREFERGRTKRVGVWSEEGDGSICAKVGGQTKCYGGAGTGGVYLAEGLGGGLVAVASGGDRDGLLVAIDLLPRSPTSKVAEWAVVSKERGWGYRGLGGMRAAGYLDWSWRVSGGAATFFDEGFVAGDGGLCLVRRESWRWREVVVYGLVLLLGVIIGVCWRGRRLEESVVHRIKGAPKEAPRGERVEEERATLVGAEGGFADGEAEDPLGA
ncbi:hypothetical protein FGB62_212g03 [Gracilaria domingensis]|nr:hypothetical protein FGB62_212g03 [Gracilaria domingensis]